MIGFDKACDIALDHYRGKGISGIHGVFDLGDCWMFNGGKESDHAVGIGKITVGKEDGKVSHFAFPTPEAIARLKDAPEVPLPSTYVSE